MRHAPALARTLVALKEYLAGAADYAASIASQPEPKPEYYVERAQALAAAGSEHVDEALRCLDAGTEKLGTVPALEETAIGLEMDRQHYNAALAHVDRIIARSVRKESWLVRRGQILRQAGREDEARAAYRAALDAIAQLPDHVRARPAVQALAAQAQGEMTNAKQ